MDLLYFGKCKSIPINKALYNRIKNEIKKKYTVWPSAYASGHLVKQYKAKGGKYKCNFGQKSNFGQGLNQWFNEKWVNVCKPRGKSYEKCGRTKSTKKNYPYCRPLRRVNSKTPTTVKELSKSKINELCKKKQKQPYQRLTKVKKSKS